MARPKPDVPKVQLNLKLPSDLVEAFKRVAEQNSVSLNKAAEDGLRAYTELYERLDA